MKEPEIPGSVSYGPEASVLDSSEMERKERLLQPRPLGKRCISVMARKMRVFPAKLMNMISGLISSNDTQGHTLKAQERLRLPTQATHSCTQLPGLT